MESITVKFSTTQKESEKARLTFSVSSKTGRWIQKFSFPVLATIFFLIILKQTPFPKSDFAISGKPYPVVTFLFWLYAPILFGLLFGWLFSTLAKTVRKNWILQDSKNIPPEYFGEVTVTFSKVDGFVKTGKWPWLRYRLLLFIRLILQRSQPS